MIEPGDRLKGLDNETRREIEMLLRDLKSMANTFKQNVSFLGNTAVTGSQTVDGGMTVTGDSTFNDDLTADTLALTTAAPATPVTNTLYTTNIIKAWVNFDGTTDDDLSGTYARSGTTVTVTATAHGHRIGHKVFLNFTSGTATDGIFTVTTVADANTFTVTHGTSGTTSGNVTLERSLIRADFNVQSVPKSATGNWILNFATALPSDDVAVSFGIRRDSGGGDDSSMAGLINDADNPTVDAMRISATGTGGTAGLDVELMSVTVV